MVSIRILHKCTYTKNFLKYSELGLIFTLWFPPKKIIMSLYFLHTFQFIYINFGFMLGQYNKINAYNISRLYILVNDLLINLVKIKFYIDKYKF